MKRSEIDSQLISVFKAAQTLGIGSRRLREAIRAGDLPAYRPGTRTIYLRLPELARWLDLQRVPSADADAASQLGPQMDNCEIDPSGKPPQ